jgi:hypothetical protein
VTDLTEKQQAALNALPYDHPPARYRVHVDLRERGNRKATSSQIRYVRASSKLRAEYLAVCVTRNYFARGKIVSRGFATLEKGQL